MDKIDDHVGLIRHIDFKGGLFKLTHLEKKGWLILEYDARTPYASNTGDEILIFDPISGTMEYFDEEWPFDIEYRENGTWTAAFFLKVQKNKKIVFSPIRSADYDNPKLILEPITKEDLPLYMKNVTKRFEEILKSS